MKKKLELTINFLALLMTFSFCVCAGFQNPVYVESPPFHNSYEVIWNAAKISISKDFTIVTEDQSNGTIETDWVNYQAVAFDKNVRKRVLAKIEKSEGNSWKVLIWVQTQKQVLYDGIYERTRFLWTNADPDEEEANIILMNIRLKLKIEK